MTSPHNRAQATSKTELRSCRCCRLKITLALLTPATSFISSHFHQNTTHSAQLQLLLPPCHTKTVAYVTAAATTTSPHQSG